MQAWLHCAGFIHIGSSADPVRSTTVQIHFEQSPARRVILARRSRTVVHVGPRARPVPNLWAHSVVGCGSVAVFPHLSRAHHVRPHLEASHIAAHIVTYSNHQGGGKVAGPRNRASSWSTQRRCCPPVRRRRATRPVCRAGEATPPRTSRHRHARSLRLRLWGEGQGKRSVRKGMLCGAGRRATRGTT